MICASVILRQPSFLVELVMRMVYIHIISYFPIDVAACRSENLHTLALCYVLRHIGGQLHQAFYWCIFTNFGLSVYNKMMRNAACFYYSDIFQIWECFENRHFL